MKIDIDAILKALANPVRREILAWLREPYVQFPESMLPSNHGVCASCIEAHCALSQSTVSAHLTILRNAGLLISTRIGQWVFFKRNESTIEVFLKEFSRGI
jgi:ArsR family transcriptional regulator